MSFLLFLKMEGAGGLKAMIDGPVFEVGGQARGGGGAQHHLRVPLDEQVRRFETVESVSTLVVE